MEEKEILIPTLITVDEKNAEKTIERIKKKIDSLSARKFTITGLQESIGAELEAVGDQLDAAKRKLAEMQAKPWNFAPEDLSAQASLVKELTAQDSALLRKYTAYDVQVQKVNADISTQNVLLQQTEAALSGINSEQKKAGVGTEENISRWDRFKAKVNEFTSTMLSGLASIRKSEKQTSNGFDKFMNRIKGLAKRVFVFSLITRGLREIRTWFSKVMQTNSEASAALANLKGALLTLVQPIVEFVIPIATRMINILTQIITVLAAGISGLFGKTLAQSASNAQKTYAAMNKTEKSAAKTAKSAEKTADEFGRLAGFDELNVIGEDMAAAADIGDVGADAGGLDLGGGGNVPTFDFAGIVSDELMKIMAIAGAACLAVGLILVVTGINIPLGLTMIAVGALAIYGVSQMQPGLITEMLQGTIGTITAIVSGALLVLGAILTFSGANVPLGIGLMIVGAAGLAAVVVANWNSISEAIQGPIGVITAILSTALLVLGAVITFSGGNLPLGIGLMIAGAGGLAATVAVNWETITEALQGPIGTVTAIVSGALLVLGAVLTFTGANLPLGIGLMIAGAVGLATTTAVNWNNIQAKIKPILGSLLSIISGFSLVLGILLCLTGVGIPLGIALIYAGIKGTTAAFDLSDNPITRWVKNLANSIINVINWIVDKLNEIGHVHISGLRIGNKEIIPTFDKYLWNIPHIPGLAAGTVVPPNREFMAMLGDNTREPEVVSPLSTMRQAVAEALAEANNNARLEALIDELIDVVRRKQLVISPSVKLGQVMARSQSIYDAVRG